MKYSQNFWLLAVLAVALLSMPYQTATAQLCGNFQQIPTPNPGTTGNSLVDVAATSGGTAWAIGSRSGPTTLPLILYFDGNTWTESPVPTEVAGIALSAAGSTPEGDVWLAGTRAYSVYEREVFFMCARGGAIDQIDQVLSPGAPIDLSATSASDIWALTGAGSVIHFDGSAWTESAVPKPFLTLNYPKAIYAAGPNDVWIVGYGGDQKGTYQGYVQHWDGSSWTSVPTPVDGQQPLFFLDIDGSAANDIWIVGHINYSQHLSLHWDGTSWSQQQAPEPDAPLSQVAVLGPNDAWATPYSLTAGFTFYQWDGSEWNERSSADIPGATTTAWRGLAKVGTCDVWAAGSYYIAPKHYTLTARLSSAIVSSVPEIPLAAKLLGNYPNPFNPATTIAFRVDHTQQVTISVFDVRGRRVATLTDQVFGPGLHFAEWTGQDRTGRTMPSGIYMLRMKTGDNVETRKISLVR